MEGVWQEIGQRYDDKHLAQQGKENSLFAFLNL